MDGGRGGDAHLGSSRGRAGHVGAMTLAVLVGIVRDVHRVPLAQPVGEIPVVSVDPGIHDVDVNPLARCGGCVGVVQG